MSEYVKNAMDQYHAMVEKDPSSQGIMSAVRYLGSKIAEAGNANNVADAMEILGIGHVIFAHSGISKDKNPFVSMGINLGLYRWACDKFVIGEKNLSITTTCKVCKKSFCSSHAKGGLFKKAKCPLCGESV